MVIIWIILEGNKKLIDAYRHDKEFTRKCLWAIIDKVGEGILLGEVEKILEIILKFK
jgi:hypothetical protein